jgi:hypothetical protein
MFTHILTPKEKVIKAGEFVPSFYFKLKDHYSGGNEIIESNNELNELNELINDDVIEKSYKHVINPLSSTDNRYTRFPAKLRNFDIITPIVNFYLGERRDMVDKIKIYCTNEDTINKFQSQQKKLMMQLIAEGSNAVANGEQPDYTSFKTRLRSFVNEWKDERSIQGQEAYEYIKAELKLFEQNIQLCFDFIVMGGCYTYKDIRYGDVVREVIDRRNIYVYGWDFRSKLVEDAKAVYAIRKYSSSAVIDIFRDDIYKIYGMEKGDSVIERILMAGRSGIHGLNYFNRYSKTKNVTDGNMSYEEDDLVIVEHVVAKVVVKRGILKYIDEYGMEQMLEVDDTYKLEKSKGDISIEWKYSNEVHEIWSIDVDGITDLNDPAQKMNTDVIVLRYGPISVQRNKINNTSICKLPYNGTYYGYRITQINSIAKKGKVYQEIYNTFFYKLETSINKSRDKILMMPKGLIPKGRDSRIDEEKWLYQLFSFGIGFFDEQSDRAQAAMQGIKEIDLTLGNYISSMFNFLEKIKFAYWDSIGMNRNRYGQNNSSDPVGVNEQAIYQSGLISADFHGTLTAFNEAEAEGLIDYARVAWRSGKVATYINSDKMTAFLQIDETEFANSSFGAYATGSNTEHKKVETMKQLLQPLIQNGYQGSTLAAVLDADNTTKIKELLEIGEQITKEYEQQLAKQKNDTELKIQEMKNEAADKLLEMEKYKADLKAQTEIETALLMIESYNTGKDQNLNEISDSEEAIDRYQKRQLEERKQAELERSNKAKEKLQEMKLKTKN